MYSVQATNKTPALLIYLLNISGSMGELVNGERKIDIVQSALQRSVIEMVIRSARSLIIRPNYRIAMYAYSSQVIDLLGGIKTIDELAKMGIPKLTTLDVADTAGAFIEVERLLKSELPRFQKHQPPVVCHVTDGISGDTDPEPIVNRIKNMTVPDGSVLVANTYFPKPVGDPYQWAGISDFEQLAGRDARKLFAMSSVFPNTYLVLMHELGYNIKPGARMFFPGESPELVELGLNAARYLIPYNWSTLGFYYGISYQDLLEKAENLGKSM